MRIAYVTRHDSRNIHEWSGLGFHIGRSLERQGLELDYFGPLEQKLSWLFRFKRHFYPRVLGQKFAEEWQVSWSRSFCRQTEVRLARQKYDLVLSTQPQTLPYLNCPQPLVFWTDCTFANLLNFYADYTGLCAESRRDGHEMDRAALRRCHLALYTSDWAARSAIADYDTDPAKVRVVPFGANIECHRTAADIARLVASRPKDRCQLLFIGRIWNRKGGDHALAVAKELNESGVPTQLTLVGSGPPAGQPLPPYVRALGFISKATEDGRRQFDTLLGESHFLILPTRAEAFGLVFCEASSFGVPSVATAVGGVPSVVRDGLNGRTFPLDAPAREWAAHIRGLFQNYTAYERLTASAFREYQTRLNWETAGRTARGLFEELLGHKQR